MQSTASYELRRFLAPSGQPKMLREHDDKFSVVGDTHARFRRVDTPPLFQSPKGQSLPSARHPPRPPPPELIFAFFPRKNERNETGRSGRKKGKLC